jgi:hypothetical protein
MKRSHVGMDTEHTATQVTTTTTSDIPNEPDTKPAAATSAGIYRNLPLEGKSRKIRLFDLESVPSLKSNDHTIAPLQGKLRVVSLADSPKYAALSYV